MGEVIFLQVGKIGNMIGKQFWETICGEHGINKMGVCEIENELCLKNIKSYFWEVKGLTYKPRSVLIDLEKATINTVRYSPFGQIFKPENFVFSTVGETNNWARGHLSEGAELCNSVLNIVRKEAEESNCLKAFEMVHTIGDGTGGGLGSLLLCKLADEYPKQILSTFSIFPAKSFSVEPYNAVLALHHLIDFANNTFCVDNDVLYKTDGTMDLIANVLSAITAPVRFPSSSNFNCKKFCVNATPFPRLHFFVPGMAPKEKNNEFKSKNSTVENICNLFDSQNFFVPCDMKSECFLTSTCIFRGKMFVKEVEQTIISMKSRLSSQFVEWIPGNLKLVFTKIAPPGFTEASTIIVNTTAIRQALNRIGSQYEKMFNKKAFLHWFTGEGVDLLEFEGAHAALTELVNDYTACLDPQESAIEDTNKSCETSAP